LPDLSSQDGFQILYSAYIYEDQASRLIKWTLQYPNIETGGDIFGLWLNENEVIQAVLGPGQNCRRTATSFFQDEQYLNSVGGLLIRNEGLCQVGSWLSHHTMNLPNPSSDDEDTVYGNICLHQGDFCCLLLLSR
jgi:hypothetical protein